jgi:hypothetical protein
MFIVEFATTAIDAGGGAVAAPKYPPVRSQPAMTIDVVSTQSAPFIGRFIQFHTDAPCSIAIGENPVADPLYDRMDGGDLRYVGVTPGHRLAVITNT